MDHQRAGFVSGVTGLVSARAPGVIQDVGNAGGVGSSSFGLENDGDLTLNGADGGNNWVNPATAAIAAHYQVKVDVTSGAFTSGDSTGTYLDLSSSRSWTRTGTGTVNYNVTFREKATGIVRSTQNGKTMAVL